MVVTWLQTTPMTKGKVIHPPNIARVPMIKLFELLPVSMQQIIPGMNILIRKMATKPNSRMANPATPGCDSPVNEFAQQGGITNGAAW